MSTRRVDSVRMAEDWKRKPTHEKKVSPTEVIATPMQMINTMYNSMTEVFSRPEKKEKMRTVTGVKAFNIYPSRGGVSEE